MTSLSNWLSVRGPMGATRAPPCGVSRRDVTPTVSYTISHGAVSSLFAGLSAIVIAGLACCTVAVVLPGQEQRAMMFVAAGLSLLLVLTLVRWEAHGAPRWVHPSTDAFVELGLAAALGVLVVLVASQRVATADDHYAVAAAVMIVAIASVSARTGRESSNQLSPPVPDAQR